MRSTRSNISEKLIEIKVEDCMLDLVTRSLVSLKFWGNEEMAHIKERQVSEEEVTAGVHNSFKKFAPEQVTETGR